MIFSYVPFLLAVGEMAGHKATAHGDRKESQRNRVYETPWFDDQHCPWYEHILLGFAFAVPLQRNGVHGFAAQKNSLLSLFGGCIFAIIQNFVAAAERSVSGLSRTSPLKPMCSHFCLVLLVVIWLFYLFVLLSLMSCFFGSQTLW